MGFARDHQHQPQDGDTDEPSPYAQYVEDEEELLEQSQRQVLEEKRLRPRRFRG
ncbi:MAG: hypothetical protein VKS61_13250 [Candidatus Sericytochromatia bacterium]|nr:hypothetical protein [Candidatus Sericytochromatia bacterium]